MTTLKDVISGNTAQDEQMHRSKTKERPMAEVSLQSISKESVQHTKTQQDPTPELVWLTPATGTQIATPPEYTEGYYIYCKDTSDIWYAPTKFCLDQNFIYREDLEIYQLTGTAADAHWYSTRFAAHERGTHPSCKCYILDNPCNESIEVYYDSAYPSLKYGKATPKGCFVHQYANRFHRDMAILELDDLYSNSSLKEAVRLTKRDLGPKEAIIVSDGAWMKESCSAACYYLDATQVIKLTSGFCPEIVEQAVLTAEIRGAYNALSICKAMQKTNIRYYYDNTSILNVFHNRKTEYIPEVRKYKELLTELDNAGYQIEFIELHPKTGEQRDTDNRALQFFHNRCDSECREMADIFSKDYKKFATQDDKSGTTYKQFQQQKQKPRNSGKPVSYNSQGQKRHGGFTAYK